MITYVTKNGTKFGLMTPEGAALTIMPEADKTIVPADVAEFADWLKRDPLRCYVAIDALTAVAMQQLFNVLPQAEVTVEEAPPPVEE